MLRGDLDKRHRKVCFCTVSLYVKGTLQDKVGKRCGGQSPFLIAQEPSMAGKAADCRASQLQQSLRSPEENLLTLSPFPELQEKYYA